MKLIKQLDVVSLLLWCILSFNLIENINSSPITSCLDLVEGQVIYPNDEPFRKLIIDENIKVNYTPSALVYAVNSKDVQIAVNCAVKLKTDIIARSGGHSYENYGLGGRDDVIVLDVTNFNEIIIDSGAKTAKVGAGNRLGVVYDKLNQAGFLIPAGSCPSVGIGGHALGGGYGFYSRKYGLVSDNVISMEMVDASGNLLQINSTSNPDLFFALRGAGGGSYGIVISFVFRIHPTPPQVTLMQFDFNQTQVQKLFDVYNKIGPSLDDGIVLQMSLGEGSLSITGVYLGSSTKARNAMKEFLSKAPKPTSSEFKQQTFFDSVIANSQAPKNEVVRPVLHPYFFKAKSFIVKKDGGLTPQAIKTMINFLNSVSCDTFTLFDLFDGGATHIVDNTSSFIHRDVLYVIQMVTSGWKSKEQGDKCIKELNDFGKKFQSNFTSYFSYQNYIDRDLDDWQTRYYGDNFKKLVEIKAKYDPNNLFNFPQSIPVKI